MFAWMEGRLLAFLLHIHCARYEVEVGMVDSLLADTGLPDQVLLRSVALPLKRTAVHNGARLNAHAFACMFTRNIVSRLCVHFDFKLVPRGPGSETL
jgi:hypothetical protein